MLSVEDDVRVVADAGLAEEVFVLLGVLEYSRCAVAQGFFAFLAEADGSRDVSLGVLLEVAAIHDDPIGLPGVLLDQLRACEQVGIDPRGSSGEACRQQQDKTEYDQPTDSLDHTHPLLNSNVPRTGPFVHNLRDCIWTQITAGKADKTEL